MRWWVMVLVTVVEIAVEGNKASALPFSLVSAVRQWIYLCCYCQMNETCTTSDTFARGTVFAGNSLVDSFFDPEPAPGRSGSPVGSQGNSRTILFRIVESSEASD